MFARYCEASALMPMMQYSLNIWDLGNPETRRICRKMSALHAKYGDYIIACAKAASQTGAPMVRAMEYAYPHCGYGGITDQYLLGDRILVAPVLKRGNADARCAYPPANGDWATRSIQTKRSPSLAQ